ncbi:hypothetical protein [Elizabethkingia sp. HX XZB]|uniref:hypothetical protein n=1 Tax=Elizabethkingia sp. HX XZB TaxID=3003193 RepID=UPI002A24CD59|nr:hypothetical protein [Elizabethkingia sp. HX XZB]
MIKNLSRFPLWGVFLLFLLFSCRSESDMMTSKNNANKEDRPVFRIFTQQQQNVLKKNLQASTSKFSVSDNSLSNTDYYALSFAKLYDDFFTFNEIPLPSESEPQIDFRFHSELIETSNGDKAVIFPVVKSGGVIGLRMAILEENGTYLRYDYLDDSYPNYDKILALFTLEYFINSPKPSNISEFNPMADCRKNPSDWDCTIDPVIIPGKPKPKPLPPVNPFPPIIIPYPTPIPTPSTDPLKIALPSPGWCIVYNNCNGKDKDDKTDACSRLKGDVQDPKFKEVVEKLKGKLNEKDEYGHIKKYDDVDFKELTIKKESDDQGGYKVKSLGIPLEDFPKTKIYAHSHPNSREDGNKGIPMFSPKDMAIFIEMVEEAQKAGRPLNEPSAVMVSRIGTYTLKFTGDKNTLDYIMKNVNKLATAGYLEKMERIADSEDSKVFEEALLDYKRLFLATDGGVNLYRNEADGTNSKVRFSSHGGDAKVVYDKCPE